MHQKTDSHSLSEEPQYAGSTCWKSPSNIALVKYWGKHGRQLPSNPSISFTLQKAYTETVVKFKPAAIHGKAERQFYYEGNYKPEFESRIKKHIDGLQDVFPFLGDIDLKIDSCNTFPHSAGIASSASAMSALALCLSDMEQEILAVRKSSVEFFQKASHVARLGSGSACRSVYGGFAAWGEHAAIPGSSDHFAVPLPKIDPVFETLFDSICIVSTAEKPVSSSAGHALMHTNPYAEKRFESARKNCTDLLNALSTGDLEKFGDLVESEALTLHAMMMTSTPSYLLMHPKTLQIIAEIRTFRRRERVPVYFTLDAGPNVHVIYPGGFRAQVKELINSVLAPICVEGYWIDDQIGKGPEKIKK